MGTFGEKFRKERERRGFSLDDVSHVTKIGARMLKAIEDEHFDQLPGGVFNKGFIRAYARHLGLNDEEAITEYLSALREAQVEAQTSLAPAATPTARRTADASPVRSSAPPVPLPAVKPPVAQPKVQVKAEVAGSAREELPELQLPKAEHIRPRRPAVGGSGTIPWTVPALVALLLLLGIVLWTRHSRSARAGAENATHAPTSNLGSSPSATEGSSSSGPRPTETAATETGTAPAAAAQPPTPASSGAPVSRASTSESDPATESDVTTRNPKPRHSAAATPEPAPALKLVIRAAENSWISIVADGQQVTQETLIAPAHTSTRASREIIVKVGNAAGVSFLLNGKEFSVPGNEAEVKTFVFDNTGMRTVASGQGQADTINQ